MRFQSVALILLNLCVFAQTWNFGFFQVDDHEYVTENGYVLAGLTSESVLWAIQPTVYASNWVPLVWFSLMLDTEIYGGFPGGYHCTSVVLHTLNGLVLLAALRRLTGESLPSFVVVCLFAVHPLHVESVAWISERKDVLSTLFGVCALWGYARYAARPGIGWYLLTWLLFLCSLLSKQMLVTFPIALLLLDVWPLQRFGSSPAAGTVKRLVSRRIAVLVMEKLPFLVLSSIFTLVALWAQDTGGATQSFERYSLPVRIGNAIVSYVEYLRRTIWPLDLAVYYPHSPQGLPSWQIALSAILLTALTAVSLSQVHKRPYLAVGWFWYLLTLLPVIGLIQIGEQSMADRYTYVPLIGVFVAVTWLAAEFLPARCGAIRLRPTVSVLTIGLSAIAAWIQTGYWKSSETLLTRTIAVTQDNWFAQAALGGALMADPKRWTEAEQHLREAIRIQPNYALPHYSLGLLLSDRQLLHAANAEFRRTLELTPQKIEARLLLCLNLKRLGAFTELQAELAVLETQKASLPPELQTAIESLKEK